MSSTRRRVIASALGLAASGLAALPPQAAAQTGAADWPARPLKIVVGFAAGTPPDVFARIYGEYAARKLGVPVIVDNKPGSAGNLASDAVAKSPADGYTVLYNVSTAFTINPFIYGKLPFDADKDLVPVAPTMRQGLVLIASPKLEAASLKDVLAQARSKPDQLSHASYGAGSPSHLIMEWLKDENKVAMLHVPYRATPINELIGGQVDMVLEPMATAYPLISSGKVKALAYSDAQRHPAMPNVPTFAETTPGLSMMSWHGIWAPAATPAPVLDKLYAVLHAASLDTDVQRRIKELNCEPLSLDRAEMAQWVRRDAGIYSRIVKARNIRVD
ncbi:tripartite tricarboxylate transporter substrate binding protein [Aquincola tertiaricarbonis]|uniref:Tripartite tricarboxylate transporter substrate binding protein n=1 Tax=Aquincola tertiaricarbonis TaxID=391953 RepID=A0ABY4S5X6_AQUTE|nr:tripartite tricarboxylate transporter substrate binding protein [Aquincola tertiaricarbonis]URI07113.1 tripartite tricarboxylate transporter substrate binding protein [Aquincola tertiaricarbonis]